MIYELKAFMAMFQIITQEGWTEFVVEVLRSMDDRMVPFVAVYFVAYHLFVTLVSSLCILLEFKLIPLYCR